MKPVVFLLEAQAEYLDAQDWYRARSIQAALDFNAAVNEAIQRVADGPNRWPKYDRAHRFHIVAGFPYSVVYREDALCITVAAIAHASRKPGYWKNR